MLSRNPVAERTRDHRGADELGRVVFGAEGETTRTAPSSAAEVGVPVAPAPRQGPVPLGTTGRLGRILMALTREACAGPRDRERVRASADVLLETIRALSAF